MSQHVEQINQRQYLIGFRHANHKVFPNLVCTKSRPSIKDCSKQRKSQVFSNFHKNSLGGKLVHGAITSCIYFKRFDCELRFIVQIVKWKCWRKCCMIWECIWLIELSVNFIVNSTCEKFAIFWDSKLQPFLMNQERLWRKTSIL